MKRILLLLLGIVSATLGLTAQVDTIPATDSLIEYTGRIDFTNPAVPTFSYSGVSIRACFTGTSIAMIMNDDIGQNYYDLILDGKMLDTLHVTTGKKIYKIAAGLKDTTHEIEIFKRTELTFGKTQFFGFVVNKGDSLTTIKDKRPRLMEYIGNSITCGYGDEGVLGQTFGPTTEDHYMTYAAITSRNFNARHLAVCRSGIGVYRDYNGPATGNTDNMTNYYTRIFLYDPEPKYSFSETPDLVCINLGTNDFSTNGGDSALFVSNYFRLIDTIQTKYNKPDIVCLLGPMLSGATLTQVRGYLKFIADSANRKGKGNVYFFEMSQETGDLGIGIDYHPTVAQHKRNAQELTEFIKSIKGWKITPLVRNADVTTPDHIKLEFNTPLHDPLNTFSGFTVFNDSTQLTIDSVYLDTADHEVIHILLHQKINVGEKVDLSYTPGTLESDDSMTVGVINSLAVQNDLTETKITSGTTSSDGREVMLMCNKNIKKNSTIDGLTLTGSHEKKMAVDSFSIASLRLTVYINDTIRATDTVFASYNGTNLLGDDDVPVTGFSKLLIKNSSTYSDILSTSYNSLNIFPNPNSSGIFLYRLGGSVIPGKTRLVVINEEGKVMHKQLLSEAEGKIDLRNKIPKGLYIFKFTLGRSTISRSVVLE